MIYFVPNDQPYRADVVDSMKTVIRTVQSFYAEQMQAHGYDKKTFRYETDAQGKPLVHRVNGKHPESYYFQNIGAETDEIGQVFDLYANVFLVVIGYSSADVRGGGGIGVRYGKNGGYALIARGTVAMYAAEDWDLVAHELGHVFGLGHDFRNDAYIMSYGSRPDRLSACAAQFLSVHTYFNPDIPTEEGSPPHIGLTSPLAYPAGLESVPIQLQLDDPAGLHQVLFLTHGQLGGPEIFGCRQFTGVENATVETDYDGLIPSDGFTSLSDPPSHTISVIAVNMNGDVSRNGWVLSEISPFHVATLEGHGGPVNSVSFSPDGTMLATGSWDSTVKLWKVATGGNPATIEGHVDMAEAASVSFSPDGSILAFGSRGNMVKLWDVAAGELTAAFEHTDRVVAVSFSPDGSILASASWDNTVRLWDVAAGELMAAFEHTDRVVAVSFSPDGSILASASWDNTVKLWDITAREGIATLETGGPVSFSPDGKTLASYSFDDGTVKLWNVATREIIATFHGSGPFSFSSDGTILAVGAGFLVELWDLATGEVLATLSGHNAWVTSVSFAPDGTVLASGSDDGLVITWDASGWTQPRPFRLVKISGDDQQGAPGSALAHPFTVEVRDQYDNPLPGVSVTFSVVSGGGRISGRFTVEKAITDSAGRAERTLTLGPRPGTDAVEVSLGGNRLVTFHAESVGAVVSGMEGDFQTWQLPTGAIMRFGKGSVGGIYGNNGGQPVAFSPDGNTFAAASRIGVWLYDVATSRELALLPFARSVRAVSFSPNGTYLASGSDDGTVKMLELSTGTIVTTLEGHRGGVTSVSFSPDGTTLASGGSFFDSKIKLWDTETGTNTAVFDHHTSGLKDVEFSPDGSLLATAGGFSDPAIRLWDLATRELKATLEGHNGGVMSVSFSPDGNTLASGSEDYTIMLWDVETGSHIASLEGHNFEVVSVSFSPNGNLLASGSRDATVKLWNMATREPSATLSVNSQVSFVSFSPDGETLVFGLQSDDKIKLWDLDTGNTAALSGHIPAVTTVSFSPDGNTFASGANDYTIRLWDVATGNPGPSWRFHWVSSVSFSPDGTTLASASGFNVVLWDAATGEEIATLEGHITVVNMVSFSPDGTTLASGARDNTVRLWDVSTREPIATLEGHRSEVFSVAFSPDGTTLASGSDDGIVKLWDVATGVDLATLEGHGRTGFNPSVVFSPDGTALASGSGDNTVRLWDVSTRSTIAVLEGSGPVVFSPDGTTLVSGLWQNVKLWDLATETNTFTLEGHTEEIHSLSFSPDGQTFASGSRDGTILLWDMQLLQPRPHTLIKVAGDKQQGAGGAQLAKPFVVWVRDQHGDLFAGATVTFAVTSGEGTLSVTTATTDANGRAAATLTLGSEPGTNTVEVTVAELEPVTFTATGQVIPQTLGKVSGDAQEGPSGAALSAPFVVSVLDQAGEAFAGATVTFAVTAGEGTLTATTATTDADGRAASTLTLGSEPGTNTVEVRVAELEPVTFTATAEATADFDGDGDTGFDDFFLFADAFGGSDPRFDLDGSGSVDFADFFLLVDHFADPEARGKLLALARELIGLPDGPQLQQNAPNPFNSETVISWFLLRPGPARVEVFALTGQRVAVLRQGPEKAGVHRVHWNGRDDRGRPLASGVYLYRLVTDEAVQTRKLTLLR